MASAIAGARGSTIIAMWLISGTTVTEMSVLMAPIVGAKRPAFVAIAVQESEDSE
jgi:hypothetical protein